MKSDQPQILPLTSLRFFAAIMVVAHHYWGFDSGFVGVGFFFVLSGYVIKLNYAAVPNRTQFWWKRFARIYPLHLITLLASIPMGFLVLEYSFSAALLQSWLPIQGIYFSANVPSWSISDEAFFYAAFPFLLRLPGWSLAVWGASLVLLAAFWTFIFPDWTLEHGGSLVVYGRQYETPITQWVFGILPITRLFEFALGMWLTKLKSVVGTRSEIIAVGFAILSVACIDMWPPAFRASLFFAPAAALLVYVFAKSSGIIARLLSVKIIVILGEASFALYMIHYPIGRYLGHSYLTGILAVGLSVCVWRWVELPAQRALMKFYRLRVCSQA